MATSQIAASMEQDLTDAYNHFLKNHSRSEDYLEGVNSSTSSGTSSLPNDGYVEIILQMDKDYDYLFVIINDTSKEVQITQATLPASLQNNGITSGIIKETFNVASKYGYGMSIGNISNSRFHQALVKRKALPLSPSYVKIVDVQLF
jgi:hypothetical protein